MCGNSRFSLPRGGDFEKFLSHSGNLPSLIPPIQLSALQTLRGQVYWYEARASFGCEDFKQRDLVGYAKTVLSEGDFALQILAWSILSQCQ